MALSFGGGGGNLMGPFATGKPVKYGGNKKPMSLTNILFGNGTSPSDFVLGTPVSGGGRTGVSGAGVSGSRPVVNSAQVDGSTAFLNTISAFGSQLLAGIGGQPEQPPATVQPASYNPMSGGGLDTKTLLMIGAAGVAIYYVAKS